MNATIKATDRETVVRFDTGDSIHYTRGIATLYLAGGHIAYRGDRLNEAFRAYQIMRDADTRIAEMVAATPPTDTDSTA